jgi:hypothetical protein
MSHAALLGQEKVKELVFRTCREVEKNDYLLWEYKVGERAFAHRLATYLEKYFPEYHVDCEYNKQGTDGENKNLDYTTNGIYADILVHKRGDNDDNLLHIELKRSDNRLGTRGIENDLKRLKGMKQQPKLYVVACLIIIDKESKSLQENYV